MSDGLALFQMSILWISIICTCLEKHKLIFYQFFPSEVAAFLYIQKKEHQEKFQTYEKEIMLKENTDKYFIRDLSVDRLIYRMQEIIRHEQQFQTDLSLCIIAKCPKCGTIGNITYKSVKQGLPAINKNYRVCRSCLLARLHVS